MPIAPTNRVSRLLRSPLAALACLLAPLAVVADARAQAGSDTKVSVRAAAALAKAAPGDTFPIAVELAIEPEWHVWTSEAQAAALPDGMVSFDGAIFTSIAVSVEPAGAATVSVADIQWPEPHGVKGDLGEGPQTFGVFEGKVTAFVPVVVSGAASGEVRIKVTAGFQACSTTCLAPADVERTVVVQVAPGAREAAGPAETPMFAGFDPAVFGRIKEGASIGAPAAGRAKPIKVPLFGWDFELDPESSTFFPVMLLLAFVGGAILNFTPCVLPVIPLKVMGLAGAAGGDRRRTLLLGVAMTAGVVAFWAVLGGLLGFVKGFEQSNQLFQHPEFTIGVGAFIAVMAVGMAGFFSVGLPQWVYAIEPKHETMGGSVIFGVMTAVLSTPCTAPLMGAAAGWAATTRSPATIMTVFVTIGLGMGAPYLVLSAYPQLARRLPKSGPASDVLKQVMGLLLLAAAFYFIGAGINGLREGQPLTFHYWLIGLTGAAAGAWLAWRALRVASTARGRAACVAVGAAIAAISLAIPPLLAHERLPWRPYTAEALAAAQRDGKVAVLDFTAEWCANCKFLEKTVLESDAVSAVLEEPGVALLKADITGKNAPGSAKLAELGRVTIPLLVVYAPNGTEVLKSEAYTGEQVIAAVRKAQGRD